MNVKTHIPSPVDVLLTFTVVFGVVLFAIYWSFLMLVVVIVSLVKICQLGLRALWLKVTR